MKCRYCGGEAESYPQGDEMAKEMGLDVCGACAHKQEFADGLSDLAKASVRVANIQLAMCRILIDQGRYIGEDPVGYACTNKADFQEKDGTLWCRQCREIFSNEPWRITRPVILQPKKEANG